MKFLEISGHLHGMVDDEVI